jgi:hypothetical protein
LLEVLLPLLPAPEKPLAGEGALLPGVKVKAWGCCWLQELGEGTGGRSGCPAGEGGCPAGGGAGEGGGGGSGAGAVHAVGASCSCCCCCCSELDLARGLRLAWSLAATMLPIGGSRRLLLLLSSSCPCMHA